jgi:prepilin-type processing-associated H-X9-DG protein
VKLIRSRLGLGRLSFAGPPLAFPPAVPEAQQVVASFWLHELDPHPNRRAQVLFADVLEQFLCSRGLFSGSRTRSGSSAASPG